MPRRDSLGVLLLLIVLELGCVGLWAVMDVVELLLAALATGLAIVYLVVFLWAISARGYWTGAITRRGQSLSRVPGPRWNGEPSS